jgi:hypothetical protein
MLSDRLSAFNKNTERREADQDVFNRSTSECFLSLPLQLSAEG